MQGRPLRGRAADALAGGGLGDVLGSILGGMAGYTIFSLVAAFSPRFELFAALQVPLLALALNNGCEALIWNLAALRAGVGISESQL